MTKHPREGGPALPKEIVEEQSNPESEVSPDSLNLLTNYDRVLGLMAQVEGIDPGEAEKYWRRDHERDGEYSARGVANYLEELNEEDPEIRNDSERGDFIVTTVYGSGGVFRWGVTNKGEVKFSEHHARLRPDAIEKAKALGFKTY